VSGGWQTTTETKEPKDEQNQNYTAQIHKAEQKFEEMKGLKS
jgi:hypothetical protein